MFRRRKRSTDDFSEELKSHLTLEADQLRKEGLDPAQARSVAQRKFGNLVTVEERFYEAGRWVWLEQLRQDIRYAARQLLHGKGFTFVSILTLALGIGVTTAIFTVVNGVLLRPLPYPQPGQLVAIKVDLRRGAVSNVIPFSYTRDYATWRTGAKTLSGIAGYMRFAANFWDGGEGERVECALATESLFPLLGAEPVLGRRFLPEEDRPGGPPVALLSHRFWRTHFGGDRAVIGRTFTL